MTIETLIQALLTFIQTNGYVLILVGTILEGPIVTTAAAFAASLGYFNIFIIFLLAVFGDLIGDTLHFFVGRMLRRNVVEKHGEKIGLSRKRLMFIEKNFKKHLGKVIVFLKLMPPMTSIGLLMIGSSKRIKYKEFIFRCSLAIVPISLFYTLLGYFLGTMSTTILKYARLGEYALFFLVVAALVAYLIVKKVSKKVEVIEDVEIKKKKEIAF